MAYTFGFIGAGNMGSALVKGAIRKLPPDQIIIADRNRDLAQSVADRLHCHAGGNEAAARESRFLFLGVKPHILSPLLHDLRPIFQNRSEAPILVSMAAGVSLTQIEEMAGHAYPVIRIMPNTPVSEGAGVVLCARNHLVTDENFSAFTTALSGVGIVHPIDESLIDAGTAVSGCGPAFTYLFIDALADGGVACGLSRNEALQFAAQTVMGAAQIVLSSGKHPEMLKNEVCSPGGSTIQGVRTLEQRALRASCMDAVIATFDKTVDLGKG